MKTNNDYKDELKQALAELDEPKKKRDKENDFLNVILGILIVLIVVVGIAGAVLIGKTYVNLDPKDPIVNNDSTTGTNDKQDNLDQDKDLDADHDNKDDELDNDSDLDNEQDNNSNIDQNVDVNNGIINVKNEPNGDFEVLEFKVSREEGSVRFDIQSKTSIAGNIFLMDDKSLSIGPISINEGTNNLYFLINGQNNYELHFDASNGRAYIYEISKEEIKEALNE